MASGSASPALDRRLGAQRYDLEEALARTMPDVLGLLQDGRCRGKREIITALVDLHAKEDVKRAIMRLVIIGQLSQVGSAYGLAAEGGA